jgi:hypothetical protein
MIDKECAKEIRSRALNAVSELTRALQECRGRCSADDYERIRKGVGLSVGKIQTELLDVIYSAHPDLDDLT